HDLRVLRVRERNFDDLDAELGTGRVAGRSRHAPRYFLCRAHTGVAGDIDVDVVAIAGIGDDRVRMRSATRLHVRDEFGMRDVGDVENANAAESLLAHRIRDVRRAAVVARAVRLAGDENQIAVDRRITLTRRAQESDDEFWRGWRRDIPD